MKNNVQNTADLIGRQALLTTFVEEVVRSSPNMAATILMNIKELSNEHHPLVTQAFTMDHFENHDMAGNVIKNALHGFDMELAKMLKLTVENLKI
ncbi:MULTISPECIES: hypothetical protein [Acinetobacter calcoaceticus/baumannii complex]|uniref:hypothetical protein n=1 Tax=Acinetobacter calcoaceticus/baumannii complex TaxID=909768 RepID=UPI0004514A7A|nr:MULTISPECIES: hypothetical protein [Acinetobacter calcoaceticus/baumannii complex]EXR42033.1 hypothetical protein J655_1963 [Acinetobacter sp. 1294243]MBN6530154.1 hypothetical protein [Acinetobacter pittii]MDX6036453.1 hypothetical protein [Acinetobacter baumannii]OBA12007.1 hypothetical protein A9988_09305 [Acinetobacter calcoaceticus]